MAQVETRLPRTASDSTPAIPPSVLVVLVVKDGAAWLQQCLRSLSRQTHRRIGVLAIDNGSLDASAAILEESLGRDRVQRLERNVGFAGAVAAALRTEAAQQADYVLFMHDDAMLSADAVARMVRTAELMEDAGVVGPKVLDWGETRNLREIGFSADRFGYPYSALEDGEIDQGQYDRIREVLFVSSCAMLVSRAALGRIGPPDERFRDQQEDLEFCWRARLAGFRVLMVPAAVAYHRGATHRGERPGAEGPPRARYLRERAALASILKNYGLLSLLWILPLYLIQGVIRVMVLAATRRFEDAYQVLAAWGWNVAHLPGTLRLRVRAQAVRAIPDRVLRRSMAPAGIRLRKWASSAAQAVQPTFADSSDEEGAVPTRVKVARFATSHPVATAWVLAGLLGIIGYRSLRSASPLTGGVLQAFPSGPTDFFREMGSGLRHTGLGGSEAASPALGMLGVASVLAFGSPALLQKIMLLALPAVAAAGCYRAVRAETGERLPAVVAGACFGLSSAVLWALSEGRIPALVFLAGLPWLATKISHAFLPSVPLQPARWVVGAALGLAVLVSFFPGSVLAAVVLVLSCALVTRTRMSRLRGLGLSGLAIVGGAVLVFPLSLEILRAGGGGVGDRIGAASFSAIIRLSPGSAPGDWPTGTFLPIAAGLSLILASGAMARPAARAALAATASVYLAWLSAGGYLPSALGNTVAYLGVAAFGFALLVGLGLSVLLRGVPGRSFDLRRLGAALMVLALSGGLLAQAAQAAAGRWAVGGSDRVPPAYPLVGVPVGGPYRVLWLGQPDAGDFPSPGGPPDGSVDAGPASVRFAVTLPGGASALDIGRPSAGPGYDQLNMVLEEILAGNTRHGGALLSVFGIRFIVGRPGDVPSGALHRLTRQIDLDVVPTEGLTIFRNAVSFPLASEIQDSAWRRTAVSPSLLATSELEAPASVALSEGGDGFDGPASSAASLILLEQQFDPRWRLVGTDGQTALLPSRAFGWAVGFKVGAEPGGFSVRFDGQRTRTTELMVLALLWAFALWATRRPVRGW
jgi:GT2 family glycosyltransferase